MHTNINMYNSVNPNTIIQNFKHYGEARHRHNSITREIVADWYLDILRYYLSLHLPRNSNLVNSRYLACYLYSQLDAYYYIWQLAYEKLQVCFMRSLF